MLFLYSFFNSMVFTSIIITSTIAFSFSSLSLPLSLFLCCHFHSFVHLIAYGSKTHFHFSHLAQTHLLQTHFQQQNYQLYNHIYLFLPCNCLFNHHLESFIFIIVFVTILSSYHKFGILLFFYRQKTLLLLPFRSYFYYSSSIVSNTTLVYLLLFVP